MCRECWESYGGPRVTREIINAAELITAVYQENAVGGNLHVIIDDWNIDDCFFNDLGPDCTTAEVRCHGALSALSVEDRATAMAIHRGYLTTTRVVLYDG